MAARPIRLIQYGLGPIGAATAALIRRRNGAELVGAIDIDPEKVGRDVGEILGTAPSGIEVVDRLAALPAEARPDVAIHTTASYFPAFASQIEELLDAGLDIVSSSEELSFPWIANPEQARTLDERAKERGRTVLGTGVNPGFIMDALPLTLTALCQETTRIEVRRSIDASLRRGPFQRKIGAGMTVADFEQRMVEGRMGHVGLPESMHMLFRGLGHEMTASASEVRPLVAEAEIVTDHVKVAPGEVRGLEQVLRGSSTGLEIELRFIASLGADEDGDRILIDGVPSLDVSLSGTNGDLATAAILLNAVPLVVEAAPGLTTMATLPIVHAW
ncbi:MAG: dihydrodipicolinate reductase [Candidatus Bipolaricaulota bacterium]|nr:MAG: dihydrodipicolinate reductase [Candidatus Bipolaricaulota bacterium]